MTGRDERLETVAKAPQIVRHSLHGADPPWLGEMVSAMCRVPHNSGFIAYMANLARAVLAFAAAQPPSEDVVEAAAKAIYESDTNRKGGDWLSWERMIEVGAYEVDDCRNRACAALIAAAKARAGG
jgi:hypothetical protein